MSCTGFFIPQKTCISRPYCICIQVTKKLPHIKCWVVYNLYQLTFYQIKFEFTIQFLWHIHDIYTFFMHNFFLPFQNRRLEDKANRHEFWCWLCTTISVEAIWFFKDIFLEYSFYVCEFCIWTSLSKNSEIIWKTWFSGCQKKSRQARLPSYLNAKEPPQ